MLAFSPPPRGHATAPPPSILLITADDLGVQVGCYGDKAARTPHLDALARRGRLFENAYVAQASCSPSRSAMFTGLYPHANGQYGLLNAGVGFELHEPIRACTIPALLKQAGYRTGILGKLHVGPESSFPFDTRIRAATLERLKDALLAWRRETNDPLLTPEGMAQIAARETKNPPATSKPKPRRGSK